MKVTPTIKNESTITEGSISISYFAVTGEGDRKYNEDFYGHAANADVLTFVVSDGVGGQMGGEFASHLVVEMIKKEAASFDRNEMLRCYQTIEQEIRQHQAQFAEHKNMGATVAELRIDPVRQMAIWGHFGDSRVYWFRNNQVMAVTADHSVVRSLVAASLISERAALTHSKKNILLGAFGVAADISPEVLDKPVYIIEGDVFLLCTDGFWNFVSNDEMTTILKNSSDVEDWVKTLETKIRQSSSENKDNYTIFGIRITSSDDRTIRLR
jgi:serine/threonine protein phosphatase PrpC